MFLNPVGSHDTDPFDKDDAWMPIETAPKDGTHILTYRKNHAIVETWYQESILGNPVWGGNGWNYAEWDSPTHWMPLPALPKEKDKSEK